MKDNKQIAKYQWAVICMGVFLLVAGILTTVMVGDGYGALITIGSLGWFALGLMFSPQVRHDLFGNMFERSNEDIDPEIKSKHCGSQCNATVIMFKVFLNTLTIWVRKFELSKFLALTTVGVSFFVGLAMFPSDPDATSLNWFTGLYKLLGVSLIVAGVFGMCVHLRDMADKERKEKHDAAHHND